ncbi:MAG: ATP-dependent RNA helicase HrpA, partial [Panacagrimonas sp.]
SRLPSSQQDRVFSSGGPPRIVLSTNVAETSVTVPGIRYVVDVGTARLSRWSARLGIQQLQIEPVSQAAAKQRAGRCGRTGPGVCVRLYEQDDFDSRDPFTDPEIRRANLAGVILRMLALRLGDVERFDWLDAPNQKQVSAAYRLLQTLGALDENRQLSKLGIELARLPLDPRVGRIALAARGQACADEVFVLAAALSVQDPHDHPPESIATARQKHAQWRHRRSDFLTLLQLWRQWQGWSAESSNRQLRKRCREHFVSYRRMEEWEAVYRQILDLLGASPPKKPNDDPVDDLFAPIHQALLAGLVDHIGHKAPEKTEFVGPRGRKFRVFPGSALAKKPPPWIMCGTMVHTSQVFARSCARIDPDWLMQVAPHLVKRTQLAPVWDRQRGEVTCTEYRSIFGLSLGSVKRHYGSTDPDAAREIFIDHALVRGEMNNKPAFLRHNRELLSQVHEKEVRLRRPELAVDERQQYDWYAQRLPPRICTVAALKRWLHRGGNTAGLSMNEADALRDEAETDLDQQFPSQVQINAHRIRLSYAHEPGQDQDGVSFHIPLPLLFQLPATRFDWLVPGLLPARIEALIRSLPHKIRRHCTPAAHYAEVLCDRMSPDEGDLHAAICRHFLDMTGLRIAPEDFAPEKLESHLCPRLILEQEDGASIAVASSLDNLQTRHRKTFRQQLSHWCEVEPKLAQWTRPNVSNWDFGDLPDVLHSPGGAQLYPALTQVGENIVTLALHETRDAANAAHTQGLRQLLLRKCRERRKDMLRTARDQLGFALLNTVHTADSLVAACCHRAADQIWNLSQIRAAADFESALEKRAEFGHLAAALLFQSCDYLLTAAEIRKRLRSLGEAYSQAQADIRAQLESLLPEAFPMLVPGPQWKRLPLYLKAMQVRLERLINKPAKDQQLFEKLKPFQARLPHPMHPARWVMEEWRIFLFAQELRAQGSPGPDKVEAALTD